MQINELVKNKTEQNSMSGYASFLHGNEVQLDDVVLNVSQFLPAVKTRRKKRLKAPCSVQTHEHQEFALPVATARY